MSRYDEEELLGRARVAYTRNGGTLLAGQQSEVQEVDGTVYAVLRNINGILAVYQYDPEKDALTGLKEWPAALESN
ncbi:hypothetical protein [Herbaspirillum huttiense]|uniref:hypothetical protein n=1 Tax=Herbaspirillum huttiense TaxID=863372 RepID=UPI003F35C48E